MKLYVKCDQCHNYIYLDTTASTRRALSQRLRSKSFYLTCPYCQHTRDYRINDAHARVGSSGIPAGAIIGVILGGLIAGPPGLAIGSVAGATFGSASDKIEKRKVDTFNIERI